MFLPVVLCGSVRASAAAFSPTTLTGYVNSPYNIALLRRHGKLFQNIAKTVVASADGDPVRVISCGTSDYTAPSDAARPLLWDEGSGKWSLSFDGVDDNIVTGLHAGPSTFSQFGCVLKTGSTAFGTYLFGAANANASSHDVLQYANATGVFFYITNASNSTVVTGGSPPLTSAWTRTGGVYDGSVITAYRNGVVDNTLVNQTGNIRQTSYLRVSAGSYGFPGRVAGVVFVNSALGTTDRAALDAYLAALAP